MTLFPCNLEKGKTDLESPQGAEAKGHGSGTHSGGCNPLACNLPKLATPLKIATLFPPRPSVRLRFLRTKLAFNKYFLVSHEHLAWPSTVHGYLFPGDL